MYDDGWSTFVVVLVIAIVAVIRGRRADREGRL